MASTRMTMTLGREAAARPTAAHANGKVRRDRRLILAAGGFGIAYLHIALGGNGSRRPQCSISSILLSHGVAGLRLNRLRSKPGQVRSRSPHTVRRYVELTRPHDPVQDQSP